MNSRRFKKCCRRYRGFTVIEMTVIVALIGLLVVLATPTFIRARKKTQAKRIVNDARIIDGAIDKWATERSKADGHPVVVSELAAYTKSGRIPVVDVLGHPYGIGPVGNRQVRIADETKVALDGVGIDWGAY